MIRLLLLLPLTLMALGCAASGPSLEVTREGGEAYVANFDRAIFSRSADGQLDLILLAHGAGGEATVDRPLQTRTDRAIEQIVHVRVLWQHTRNVRLDNPSASNAMIEWHIRASPEDRVTYSGACWASIDVEGDEAEVELRRATVTISHVNGKLHDPLKRAMLEGEFVAMRSDATVQSYLEELAARHRDRAALSGPPVRSAVNP
jgi:hypothetical protein